MAGWRQLRPETPARPRLRPVRGFWASPISLMVAEKSGFHLADQGTPEALKQFADKMTAQAMQSMQDLGTTSTGTGRRRLGKAPRTTGRGGNREVAVAFECVMVYDSVAAAETATATGSITMIPGNRAKSEPLKVRIRVMPCVRMAATRRASKRDAAVAVVGDDAAASHSSYKAGGSGSKRNAF